MLRSSPALLLAIWCTYSTACSLGSRPIAEVVANADAIFRGRITEVRVVPSAAGGNKQDVEARFAILEQLKGVPPKSGVVRMPLSELGDCGEFHLLAGVEYLLVLRSAQSGVVSGESFPISAHIPASRPRVEEVRNLTKLRK